jgi:mRNA-degrading endonuclease toxin of MazEF toxin-antitoxin module
VVAAKPVASGARKPRAPDRQDIIWIDCNPQVGREMRDVHPFLVLSPRIFNDKTSLVIGLPMTTPEYNSNIPANVRPVRGCATCTASPITFGQVTPIPASFEFF